MMSKQTNRCPFCNARRFGSRFGSYWFSCGTEVEPDENGLYSTGIRCDRDCFARTIVEQADRIAELEAAAMNVIERRGYRSSTLKVGAMTLNEAIDNLRDALNSKGDA